MENPTITDMLKFIETAENETTIIERLVDFLKTQYQTEIENKQYNVQDLVLLQKIYFVFENNNAKQHIPQILEILEYFAKHLTGYKASTLCLIGDIYYNMNTDESIRKSVKYYQKAMYKGMSQASDALYEIIYIYRNGVRQFNIQQDKKYAKELHRAMADDVTEDDEFSETSDDDTSKKSCV